MSTSLSSWLALWQRVGAQGDAVAWHEKLISAYSESTRAYHNLQHLDECLAALENAKAEVEAPNADAIEMALWFHDAVYDPKASDNETRSAALAREALESAGVSSAFTADVERLVMATQAHTANDQLDAQWVIDIDLSILGREQSRFDEYETQIRSEYAWVPAEVYAEKRAEILASFLARDCLFVTPFFRLTYEQKARENLARLIARLRASSH